MCLRLKTNGFANFQDCFHEHKIAKSSFLKPGNKFIHSLCQSCRLHHFVGLHRWCCVVSVSVCIDILCCLLLCFFISLIFVHCFGRLVFLRKELLYRRWCYMPDLLSWSAVSELNKTLNFCLSHCLHTFFLKTFSLKLFISRIYRMYRLNYAFLLSILGNCWLHFCWDKKSDQ